MTAINVTFTYYPERIWGVWSDPAVVMVGSTTPYTVLAADNPSGRALAIEQITDALAHGWAERLVQP